jgi:hypothetical protein
LSLCNVNCFLCLGKKNCEAEKNQKNKEQPKKINVVGGMENVMLLGFCDVVMV